MSDSYKYQRPVRRSRYSLYKRYLKATAVLLLIVLLVAGYIFSGLHTKKPKPSLSPVQSSVVTTDMQTYSSPFFKFQDDAATGRWTLDKTATTATQFTYVKYSGQVIIAHLTVYINQVPIPLYLAVSRVLPVRIVNNNSFQLTGVSDPCTNQYSAGQPHIVKQVEINGAAMLCDPDSGQYSVVVSEIGGNYQLPLQRSNGSKLQAVIIYENQELRPSSGSLTNIVSSFQTI